MRPRKRDHVRTWMLTALAALFLTSGCASNVKSGCLSESFRPDAETLYRYGNFCGPGHPVSEADPANIPALVALEPVDDIDRLCKLHDLCYARFGADNSHCDKAFPIRSHFQGETRLSAQCSTQLAEITTAVVNLKVRKSNRVDQVSRQAELATYGAVLTPLIGASHCANARTFGYPDQAGFCFLQPRIVDRARSIAERELARAEALALCDHKSFGSCYSELYWDRSRTIDIDRFLSDPSWGATMPLEASTDDAR